jgi:hypothetical protein
MKKATNNEFGRGVFSTDCGPVPTPRMATELFGHSDFRLAPVHRLLNTVHGLFQRVAFGLGPTHRLAAVDNCFQLA